MEGELNMPGSDEGVSGGVNVTGERMGDLDSCPEFTTDAPVKRGGGSWQNDDCLSQSHELVTRECNLKRLWGEDVLEV